MPEPLLAPAVERALEKLGRLPIAELIVASSEIAWSLDTQGWKDEGLNIAMAGAVAMTRSMAIARELRLVEARRRKSSRQLRDSISKVRHFRRLAMAETITPSQQREYGFIRANMDFLAGDQEVYMHMFASFAWQLERLLPVSAESAGTSIPEADLQFLHSFKELRDHYEHYYNRLPGLPNETHLTIRDTKGMRVGLGTDSEGRPALNGKSFEVSASGYQRIVDIVEQSFNSIEAAHIACARDFLIRNPELAPHPDSIGTSFGVSVAGLD